MMMGCSHKPGVFGSPEAGKGGEDPPSDPAGGRGLPDPDFRLPAPCRAGRAVSAYQPVVRCESRAPESTSTQPSGWLLVATSAGAVPSSIPQAWRS